MSRTSGRFETTTKTKISTPNGSILKVIHYGDDEEYEDYRIRPKCQFCKESIGCVCYNDNNSDDPLKDVTDGLIKDWSCDNLDCVIKAIEKYNPEELKKLRLTYGDDKWSIVEAIIEQYPCEDDEGLFCEY